MDKRAVENGGKGQMSRVRPALISVLAATVPPLAAFAFERFYWSTITRWLLFNAAVIISSWIGGLKSGIFATLLSTALVWCFLLPLEGESGRVDTRRLVTTGLFIAIGVAISIFHEQLKRANRRAAIALARAESANEALERSARERRVFAALIENAWDFIGIADADGNPVYLNPGGRRMVELPDDRAVENTRISEYYTPDARAFASDVIMKEMVERGHWSGETTFRNWRTGQAIPVWDTHFRIDGPDGTVIGFATITRDMSLLRRARDETEEVNRRLQQATRDLNESQQLLKAVFDHSPSAIVVKDLEGRYVMTNRTFEQILGLSRQELRGKTDYDILRRPDADLHRAADEEVVKTGRPVTREESGELKDGLRHTFLETVFPLRDAHGAFGICWVGTEVTEMKRAEEALRAAAADLKEAQRVAHLGSWSWDIKTDSITWSEELFRIFDRDPATPPPDYHRGFSDLFTPESAAALQSAGEKLLRDGEPYEIDLELVRQDGPHRWIAARGEAVRDETGKLVALRGTAQDITQLKLLQRMKDEWMSVIAHDLRQPIGVIKMSAELLPDLHVGGIGQQEGALTERIRAAANALARMVGDLLDMSRLEAHRLSLQQAWLDPRTIVHQTVERLAHLTAGRRVVVSEAAPPSAVYVDPVRFDQVLGNLISNAVKYGNAHSEIRIHVAPHPAEVEIAVTNEGKGISTEEMPRLFTRFGRSESTRGDGTPGLGLGLYIAKGLVEAHGGRIWVDSVPEKTTTFHFTLPCRASAKEAA